LPLYADVVGGGEGGGGPGVCAARAGPVRHYVPLRGAVQRQGVCVQVHPHPRDPLPRLGANKINGTPLDPAWPKSNPMKILGMTKRNHSILAIL